MSVSIKNRRAWHDYHILDKWEAGIQLLGLEVKAIRDGNISISESWVRINKKYVHLVGVTISPKYIPIWENYEPTRDRVLLLHKNQIKKLSSALQKGLTIIPLRIYTNDKNLIKVEIATARGKKSYDKRKTIKERDSKRYGY